MKFHVYDNVSSLRPEDWNRVVCVVAAGNTWQFKGYNGGKWSEPVVLFNNCFGVYIYFEDEKVQSLGGLVKTWKVKSYGIDRAHRYNDLPTTNLIMSDLDKFMRATKPWLGRTSDKALKGNGQK